ncbi:MAG: helix-turn-helix domain-containing protein [Saprospiraceae bacterium]
MLSETDVVKLLFAFKVKYLRLEQGLGLEELAEASGLSKSYIHDLEKGKKYPKPDKIHVLARALQVDYDYLVSRRADKKIQPVIDLLTSDVLREFPLEDFGVSTTKLMELLVNTPERVTAFISTITHIIRHFQVEREHLYFTALRSFQNLKNNYFEEVEEQVRQFREWAGLPSVMPEGVDWMEELLAVRYGVTVNRNILGQMALPASGTRSYMADATRVLYIRPGLSVAQERFLMGRELAFRFMELTPRPYETRILEVLNFEVLYNNFLASYFASALLMEEAALVKDIQNWADQLTWHPADMVDWLDKYGVTPEMLMQRLSNLLPHHLGLSDLFFIRLQATGELQHYRMTKELHLDRPQNPYANALNEHYCRRWVSVNIIKQARQATTDDVLIQAQMSTYKDSGDTYLCISMAVPGTQNTHLSSVTLGLLVNEALRSRFRFLNDPALPSRVVNTTCERCSIADCEARVRPATVLEQRSSSQLTMDKLRQLDKNKP